MASLSKTSMTTKRKWSSWNSTLLGELRNVRKELLTAHKHQSNLSCLFIISRKQSVTMQTYPQIGMIVPLFSRTNVLIGRKIYWIFIMPITAWSLPLTLYVILYSHQRSHYRGRISPTQYQSADLRLVISKSFAKQSHVILNMIILKVCWEWKLKLPVPEINISPNY